jgi:hypothetical protein
VCLRPMRASAPRAVLRYCGGSRRETIANAIVATTAGRSTT